MWVLSFFFNDTATTEIYTLSLHDALPISSHDARPHRCGCRPEPVPGERPGRAGDTQPRKPAGPRPVARPVDRKSTRLNSSHANISYAVFCLKKKTTTDEP